MMTLVSNETLNNLLYMLIGGVAGLILGWTLKAKQYAKETRDRTIVLEHRMDERDERGWYTHKLSLWIVVTITAGSAIWTGVINGQLHRSQDCTEGTFASVIGTLNSRTSATSDVSRTDTAQSLAFATLLTRVLDQKNPPTELESRGLTQDYLTKLNAYNKAKEIRDASGEFPTEKDYTNCLRGKK
jgi:hypothetical protein